MFFYRSEFRAPRSIGSLAPLQPAPASRRQPPAFSFAAPRSAFRAPRSILCSLPDHKIDVSLITVTANYFLERVLRLAVEVVERFGLSYFISIKWRIVVFSSIGKLLSGIAGRAPAVLAASVVLGSDCSLNRVIIYVYT